MIKKITLGKYKNVVSAEMGKGSVIVAGGNGPVLTFHSGTNRNIKAFNQAKNGEEINLEKPSFAIVFTSHQSVNTMIADLLRISDMFESERIEYKELHES